MSLKLSISGIRGKYYELTPNMVINIAHAFSTYIEGGNIVMCCDARPSGKFITTALKAGLASSGSNVYDYGTLPTPIIQWIIKNYKFDGGVSVTGGHNPFEWNSLILLNSEGSYLSYLEGEEFFNLYHWGNFEKKKFDELGHFYNAQKYLEDYFKQLESEDKPGMKLKFVVDCSNGFDSVIIDYLSRSLNINLIPIFCGKSELLQKDPVPNSKNAEFLATVVRESGSDGGFLLNSDASRILVVDERGKVVSEELTLPIFARMILEDEKSDIVTNYSTSKIVDRVGKNFGVKVFRTDVGQPHVVQMVREIKTKIGGEGSGSVVYSPFSYGFDSFIFIKKIVEYLRKDNLTISSITEEFEPPEIYKETVYLPPHKIYNSLERIGNLYSNKTKLKDGFYIENGDEWLCIRSSATVSMIRIVGEGKSIGDEIARIKELLE